MKKKLLLISLAFVIALGRYAYAQSKENPKVLPPHTLEYDNKTFRTLPGWKDSDIYLEANLDDEPGYEVILGFIATYKPESQEEENEDKVPFAIPKKREIVPVENHAFYQIYKKTLDGNFRAIKTISGMDQLGRVEIISLDAQGHKALAIFGPGGEHYTDLSIYQWKEGGYRLVFNEGSSQAITINAGQKPAVIRIGASGDKEKAFIWNSVRDGFKQID